MRGTAAPAFLAVSLGGLFPALPAEMPSFSQIWHDEVFLGEVAAAAGEYQNLYLSPPSPKLTAQIREKAAFRAGLCFEKLGQIDHARLAYRWIQDRGPTSPALASEVKLRLSCLPSSAEASARELGGPGTASAISAAAALRKLLDGLTTAERQRADLLHQLKILLEERRAAIREREELRDRLLRQGVTIIFPLSIFSSGVLSSRAQPSASFGTSLLEGLKSLLSRDADFARIQASLGARFLERAFLALLAGEPSRAVPLLLKAGAFLPGQPVVSRWLRRLEVERALPGALAPAARRDLLQEDLARRAALRREVRTCLESAEGAVTDRGRVDLAVGYLHRIRDLEDWARPAVREDPEVRSLSSRGEKLLHLLARSAAGEEALLEVLGKIRLEVGELISAAEDLADVEEVLLGLEGPAVAEGEADSWMVSRREMERLIFQARNALGGGDRSAALECIRDGAVLLKWFPELDPWSEYRWVLDGLRQAAAPSG
jgi:hypothetical protein